MAIVTCQHSGVEFESKSGRAKNHPALDGLLKDAYKRGVYGETMDALKAVREAGGYQTIDQYVALVNERIDAAKQRRRAREEQRAVERANAEREAKERKARREAENALLKQHGFRWVGDWGQDTFDEYEEPSGRPPTHWYLYAPDDEQIDVVDALKIARGEITLADIRSEELAAEMEKERQERARQNEESAAKQREREARRQVETIEVERFDWRAHNFRIVYSHGGVTVYSGTVKGVDCGVVNRYYTFGNDYDERYSYYCADPEVAGLVRVERARSALAETFEDFFGM